MVWMYGPGVAVSRTSSSSTHSRCGPTSTGFTLVVWGAMLQLMPGGFLGIWHTDTIPSPVPRIPTIGGAILTIGPYPIFLLRGYWLDQYFLGERIYELQVATAQRRVPHAPPHHMCLLEGMTPEDREDEYIGSPTDIPLAVGDYATYFSTYLQARLPEVREYFQDWKKHRTPSYYRAQAEAKAEATAPAGPAGVVLGDVPFPPGMEVALDPALGLELAMIIPADLRQAPPPLQLDPEHATHRYQELYWRFGFARSYIARLYPELHERMEVDRLRTRLEVEGIPLDFSADEEDDDDGSSSDDAPPSPPSQAATGPSQRHRWPAFSALTAFLEHFCSL
ncbi:hypothetical protein JCGZ_22327 [Jatropha curcas]|uniref:Aminotransferase-like plant mobile domain-containing protein n=1 Tax=Jatropha curcas TaxID=180498 RepID=A0A067K214_JATCU|nr:hypothetical protein JCGZ_22327 [Jatropha curcas]